MRRTLALCMPLRPISTAIRTEREAPRTARSPTVALKVVDVQIDAFNSQLKIMRKVQWVDDFFANYGVEEVHNSVVNGRIAVPINLQSDLEINCVSALLSEAVAKSCIQSHHTWVATQVELTYATPRVFLDGTPVAFIAQAEADNGEVCVRVSLRQTESGRVAVVGVVRFTAVQ